MKRTIRIFVSSPGDVERERLRTRALLARIAGDFSEHANIEAYFWEHEPQDSTVDFAASIGSTSDFDIVLVILWSRLGNRLHSSHRRRDGKIYRSGTEYELLTALEARENSSEGLPQIAVYLNTSPVRIEASAEDDQEVDERLRQYRLLKDFLAEHFQDAEEGANLRAYNQYEKLDVFEELLEKQMRCWIESLIPDAKRVRSGDFPSEIAMWSQGNPYRGLEVFECKQAAIYFGRTRAIGEVIDLAKDQFVTGKRFLMIFGASGSGKSSLVQAGVLPLLLNPGVVESVNAWRIALFKPSDGFSKECNDPFLAMAAALLGDGALPELSDSSGKTGDSYEKERIRLAERLKQEPAAVGVRIEENLRAASRDLRSRRIGELEKLANAFEKEGREPDAEEARRRMKTLPLPRVALVLVIDQMEELFTGVAEASRIEFLKALESVTFSDGVLVLATLRSDFYDRCEDTPLMELKEGGGSYHLKPPTPVEFAQMVREPARVAGVFFENDPDKGDLADRILREADGDPDCLPLLEYCLWRLYEEGGENGILTHATYEGLGRLSGVLNHRATEVFEGLGKLERESLNEVILALATVSDVTVRASTVGLEADDDRFGVARRVVRRSELARIPGANGLIERFVSERLFTAGRNVAGEDTLSVAHEALLQHWARVSAWLGLDENRQFLVVRRQVGRRMEVWNANGRHRDYLIPPGRELDKVLEQHSTHKHAFSREERDYIDWSEKEAQRKVKRLKRVRRALITAMGVLTVLAMTGLGWALKRERDAENQVKLTEARERATSARILAETEPDAALRKALNAFEEEQRIAGSVSPATMSNFLHVLERCRGIQGSKWDEVGGGYRRATFSQEGTHLLATHAKAATVGRSDNDSAVNGVGANILPLKNATAAGISADGRIVAIGTPSRRIFVWSGSDPISAFGEKALEGSIVHLEVLDQKNKLFSLSGNNEFSLWDLESGEVLEQTKLHKVRIAKVAFSPSKEHALLTSSISLGMNHLYLLNLDKFGENAKEIPIGDHRITAAIVSSEEQIILATDEQGMVQSWTLEGDVGGIKFPTRHPSEVIGLSYHPAEDLVVAIGADHSIRVFDAEGSMKMPPLIGHVTPILAHTLGSEGRELLSFGSGGALRRWDLLGLQEPPITQPHPLNVALISPDGESLAVASASGEIVALDLESGSPLKSVGIEGAPEFLLQLEDPEAFLVACKREGRLRLIDWEGFSVRKESEDLLLKRTGLSIRSVTAGHGRILVSFSNREILAISPADLEIEGRWEFPDIVSRTTMGTLTSLPEKDHYLITCKNVLLKFRIGSKKFTEVETVTFPVFQQNTYDSALAVSEDGNRFIGASPEGRYRSTVYSTRSLTELGGFDFRLEYGASSALYLNDPPILIGGGRDGRIQIVEESERIHLGPPIYGHRGGISDIVFDRNRGRIITVGSGGAIRFWPIITSDWVALARFRLSGKRVAKMGNVNPMESGFGFRRGSVETHSGEQEEFPFTARFPSDWHRVETRLLNQLKNLLIKTTKSNPNYFEFASFHSTRATVPLNLMEAEGVLVWYGKVSMDERQQFQRTVSLLGHLWNGDWDLSALGIASRSRSDLIWDESLEMLKCQYWFTLVSREKVTVTIYFVPNKKSYLSVVAMGSDDFHESVMPFLQGIEIPKELEADPAFLKRIPQMLKEMESQ